MTCATWGKFKIVSKRINKITGKLTAGGKANTVNANIAKCLSDVAETRNMLDQYGFANENAENTARGGLEEAAALCEQKKFKKAKKRLSKITQNFRK